MSTEYEFVAIDDTANLRVGDVVSEPETGVTFAVVKRQKLSPLGEAAELIRAYEDGVGHGSRDALAKAILDLVG